MAGALDRGQAHDAPFGTVAIAPLGKTRSREGDEAGRAALSVARVSGGVSFGCGADAEGWRPASVGLPVATGDRLYAARGGCLDLCTAGFEIHLASGAGLEAIELSDDVKRFYVWGGTARLLVRELQPSESFGVATPNAAVTFERAGKYRIDVDREGSTRVVVGRGSAWVSAAGVAVPLGSGDVVKIDGIQCPVHDIPALPSLDSSGSGAGTLPSRARDQVLLFRPRQSH